MAFKAIQTQLSEAQERADEPSFSPSIKNLNVCQQCSQASRGTYVLCFIHPFHHLHVGLNY